MWRQWNHQRNHCTVMWNSSRVGSICCLKSSVFGFFFCWPRWSGSFFSSVAFFLRAWLSGFVCFVVREKCLLFQLCYQWLSKHSSHTRQVWSIFFCVVVVWFLICLHSNKGLQNYCTFIYGCNCQCQMFQCPNVQPEEPLSPIHWWSLFSTLWTPIRIHFVSLLFGDLISGAWNFVWILLGIY